MTFHLLGECGFGIALWSLCGRFSLWPFCGLWSFWFVAGQVRYWSLTSLNITQMISDKRFVAVLDVRHLYRTL